MKRSTFIAIFTITHVMFILLIIHKQNRFINLSYQKQKKEKQKVELVEKKKDLMRQQYVLTNLQHVKQIAQETLLMKPTTISQVQKLPVTIDQNVTSLDNRP